MNYCNWPFASCMTCHGIVFPHTREMQIALDTWGVCLPCRTLIKETIHQWEHKYYNGLKEK